MIHGRGRYQPGPWRRCRRDLSDRETDPGLWDVQPGLGLPQRHVSRVSLSGRVPFDVRSCYRNAALTFAQRPSNERLESAVLLGGISAPVGNEQWQYTLDGSQTEDGGEAECVPEENIGWP